MKYLSILIVLGLFVFALSAHAQSGNWTIKTFDTGTLFDIIFVDTLYGWTVGSGGKIFQSTDGGDTWNEQIHVTDNELHGVSFVNRNIGYAVGDNGTVLKTTNGGIGWSAQTTTPAFHWWKVHFANEQDGWIISGNGSAKIKHTTDGGSTWNDVGTASGFSDMWYLDGNIGWVAGGGEIWNTADGTNWTNINGGGLNNVTSIAFLTNTYGYVQQTFVNNSGFVSIIHKTDNGGNNWVAIDTILNANLQNTSFIEPSEGWTVGWNLISGGEALDGGCVYHTVDSGKTWNRDIFQGYDNYYSLLYQVFFLDKNHGWVVGKANTGGSTQKIVCSFRGNPTGVANDVQQIPIFYLLSDNYPNPFNPDTKISYSIPKSSYVSLVIYDVLGRVVAKLIGENKQPGEYTATWNADGVPSGVYFYRLSAGDFIQTKKMVLIR